MFLIATIMIHDGWMELQQMRYVLAVAEERNFTRAAHRCHIVQSAMSHQIKALERELGAQLFARTSRRVELTAAGAAFLPSARASVDAAERATAEAVAATGELRGNLTIGVIPTVTAVDIPAVLARFRQRHPAVRTMLRGGGSDEFMVAIGAGTMDIAVLGLAEGTPPRGVAAQELSRDRLVAVVGTGHRLAARCRADLTELAEEIFVDFPSGSSGRAQSDAVFGAAGIHRYVAFEAMSTDMILDLVRADLAVALLPPDVVPHDNTLRIITLPHGPIRVEYLAWSDFNPSPAAAAFRDLVREER